MVNLHKTDNPINRHERVKINENWDRIESGFSKQQLQINTNKTNAESAVEMANQAKQIADGINGKATEALETANTANGKSNTAVQTANTAKQVAEGIDGKVNQAMSTSATAETKSDNAIDIANAAKNTSENVQDQFNQVVAEAGSNNPEVVASRLDAETGETFVSLPQRLDQQHKQLTAQLEHVGVDVIDAKLAKINALAPLKLSTYDGSGQSTHPSVINIPSDFTTWGYVCVMAHTPYPNTNDDDENPSLLWSHNAEDFINFGASNPIDKPTEAQTANGAYMSDTELVFNTVLKRLELYYRYNEGANEYLYRKTTIDGVNWAARELVLDKTTFGRVMMSPSIHFDGIKYIMWAVDNSGRITRYESQTALAGSWVLIGDVTLNYSDNTNSGYTTWHLHVLKHDNQYFFTLNSIAPNSSYMRHLLIGESTDGLIVNNVRLLMLPNDDIYAFDNNYLYRASLLYKSGHFYLYYSATNGDGQWGIGISKGHSLNTLSGFFYRSANARSDKAVKIDKIQSAEFITQSGTKLTDDNLTFFIAGVKAATLKLVSSNEFALTNEAGDAYVALKLLDALLMRSAILVDDARLRFLKDGVNGADLKLDTQINTVKVTGSDNEELGHMLMSTLTLNDLKTTDPVEGMVKFNAVTKKHQGYDGTIWHDLY